MRSSSRRVARSLAIALLLASPVACATDMKMGAAELRDLRAGEGRVLGSLAIGGGNDVLGRTRWALVAQQERKPSEVAWAPGKDYTVEAEQNGEEVVFLTKMPAGRYLFYKLAQSGFSTAEVPVRIPFEVLAGKTVYVGRIAIQFPPGMVGAFTKVRYRVEDDREATVRRAEQEYGIPLAEVVVQRDRPR